MNTREALVLQNNVNGEQAMQLIRMSFGPFDNNEIEFYRRRLNVDNSGVIHTFQKDLIFNIFYKYFGDTMSVNTINETDYIILLLAAKKISEQSKCRYLPYVFIGRITRYVRKTKLNKKEKDKMITSPDYRLIQQMYRTSKVLDQMESYAATILYSDFEMIDYKNPQNDGVMLPKFPELVVHEIQKYVLWIS